MTTYTRSLIIAAVVALAAPVAIAQQALEWVAPTHARVGESFEAKLRYDPPGPIALQGAEFSISVDGDGVIGAPEWRDTVSDATFGGLEQATATQIDAYFGTAIGYAGPAIDIVIVAVVAFMRRQNSESYWSLLIWFCHAVRKSVRLFQSRAFSCQSDHCLCLSSPRRPW